MKQEVLGILTDKQAEMLRDMRIEQAEKGHEFRTLRYEYIVNDAGIEGDKADRVLSLLNAQSESRLELAKQRIRNSEEVNRDLFKERFRQMKDTDDELRSILTVDEYENLRQNLGFGFGNRTPRHAGKGHRLWSR